MSVAHIIEIDTGSRLDQSGDTTFAFSDHIQRAVRLRQPVRDRCLAALTGSALAKELLVLTACIYHLIEKYLNNIELMVIDNEYTGHEGDLKRYLVNIIKTHASSTFDEDRIRVASIGKKSKAHKVAWQTY